MPEEPDVATDAPEVPPPGQSPWRARWYLVPTVLLLGIAVISFQVAVARVNATGWIGNDLDVMTELGRRWLASGSMYLPYQLSGSFSIALTPDVAMTPALYPPAAGPVFAVLYLIPRPLTVVLWWGVPLAVLAWALFRWRPAGWSWPLLALCLVWPITWMALLAGSTSMWAAALVSLGLVFRWPAALLLVKPSLAPFALVGVQSRVWWVIAALIVVLTFAGPWVDYLSVIRNAQGLDYAWYTYPLVLMPVIAWLGRTRPVDEHNLLGFVTDRIRGAGRQRAT